MPKPKHWDQRGGDFVKNAAHELRTPVSAISSAIEALQNGGMDAAKPQLLLFSSRLSGRCRRVDGFLAQVLQRRANHATFELTRIEIEEQPGLHERFSIETLPTLVVVEDSTVRGRIADPNGCKEIERFLAPWLH